MPDPPDLTQEDLDASQRALDAGVSGAPPNLTPAAAPPVPAPATPITAPPVGPVTRASPPSSVADPPRSPADSALAALVSPRAPGPVRPIGLSPADKEEVKTLDQERQDQSNAARESAVVTQDLLDQNRQQLDSFAKESEVARLAAQDELAQNKAHRARIETETKDRQGRIEAQLATLEGQGVDPNHYWQSQGTARQIAGAIAIGLGAFAAHPLGPRGSASENTALGIINNAIGADIDAQKVNLNKALQLAGKNLELNQQGFEHETALLQAERDSIQTAYTVAQNDVSKRMAAYQDSSAYQMNGQKLIAGLKESMLERVAPINDRIYQIRKGAERMVSRGTSILAQEREKIIARAQAIRDEAAKGGMDISVGEAQRQAAAERLGVDVKPGEPFASYAAQPKGAARATAADLSEMQGGIDAINQIQALRKLHGGGTISAEDTAKGQSASVFARGAIGKAFKGRFNEGELKAMQEMVPEDPLELKTVGLIGSDPIGARLEQSKRLLQAQMRVLQQQGGGGTPRPSAEDLGGEKDE